MTTTTRQPHQRPMGGRRQLQPERQPVQHGRRAGPVHPGQCRADGRGGAGRTRRLPGLVDLGHPGPLRCAGQDRQRDPGPTRGARHAARARRRQDPRRRHRRGRPRRQDLQVLRRRMPAPGRRDAALGAPRHRRRGHARAVRRDRPDHAVELPDRDSGLEDRAGAGLSAIASCSSRPIWCRAAPGRWPTSSAAAAFRRRVQPGHGPRQRGRRRAGQPSRHRRDQLHRLAASGRAHRAAMRREPEEGAARDGRQEPAGRARRRRSGPGGRTVRAKRLLLHRPALHRVEPADRHRRHLSEVHRGHADPHGRAQGRRCLAGRHRHRSGVVEVAARAGPRLCRDRPEGRRASC